MEQSSSSSADSTQRGSEWRGRLWATALATLLVGTFLSGFALVQARGPYPLFHDEEHVSETAWRMLEHKTLRPDFYRYGSLPMYAAAFAMEIGAIGTHDKVTSVGFPYYSHPRVVQSARLLFVLFGVLGLWAAGVCGKRAFERDEMLLLAPLALSCSGWYLQQSWMYLNVDILAAAIALGASAYLARTFESRGVMQRVVVPALLCGAATATKYNSALLVLPFAVAIFMQPKTARVSRLLGLAAMSALCFVVFDPFSMIDHTRFVSDVLHELRHYGAGHAGHEGEPGLAQLGFYVAAIDEDYGRLLGPLGLFGIYVALRTRPKLTMLLLIFPVCMLLHMSFNRVNFIRTVLPVFAIYAIFVGFGVLFMIEATTLISVKFLGPYITIRGARALGLLAAAAFVFTLSPARAIYAARTPVMDSRLVIASWLRDRHSKSCELIAPIQLGFDPRTLTGQCTLVTFDMVDTPVTEMIDKPSVDRERYLVLPTWSHDPRKPKLAEQAHAWNLVTSKLPGAQLAIRAGKQPLWIGYGSIERGDPELRLFALKR